MKIAATVLDREEIEARVKVLGQQITEDYQGKKLVLIGILNGAFIFLADLAREIQLAVEIDFIRVASYGKAAASSGSVVLRKEPDLDLVGKHVLLVEDIIDSGLTMAWLREYFLTKQQVASVKTCALIDKKERRATDVQTDYVGFNVEQGFLVGYGLDYAQNYRNLPKVCALEL
ncbi:hypoxanthine phosphoribosyltransferase [Candidatus Electronema sp. PJ]|uniref:hypoxanthine phosphoribosyltransferase n=1 Tax=Candidatus Electronema sp. PJ TaxID=3401572 RepID=UPI003AA88C86